MGAPKIAQINDMNEEKVLANEKPIGWIFTVIAGF